MHTRLHTADRLHRRNATGRHTNDVEQCTAVYLLTRDAAHCHVVHGLAHIAQHPPFGFSRAELMLRLRLQAVSKCIEQRKRIGLQPAELR